MSFADLHAAKQSTRALVADQLLDELIVADRRSGNKLLYHSADVLEHWDRQYSAESQGGVTFYVWCEQWLERTIVKATYADPNYDVIFDQLVGDHFYTQPCDSAQPLTIPHGLSDGGNSKQIFVSISR